MNINIPLKHHHVLFALGIFGILFYMLGPLFFPEAAIRLPELLPVYTLLLGLGQLAKGSKTVTITTGGSDVSDDERAEK